MGIHNSQARPLYFCQNVHARKRKFPLEMLSTILGLTNTCLVSFPTQRHQTQIARLFSHSRPRIDPRWKLPSLNWTLTISCVSPQPKKQRRETVAFDHWTTHRIICFYFGQDATQTKLFWTMQTTGVLHAPIVSRSLCTWYNIKANLWWAHFLYKTSTAFSPVRPDASRSLSELASSPMLT